MLDGMKIRLTMTLSVFPAPLALGALLSLLTGGALAATLQIDLQDNTGKPLADAVVFLESREAKAVKPAPVTEVAQVSRQFTPQISVITVGTPVQFPNRDTVRHHVYSFSPIKTFELKLYVGTPATPVVFDKPGVAVLGCNIHDTMAAWVVVVETPFYGRSAANGHVMLDNVPAGSYRLRAWHPNLPVGAPALDQALTLAASGGNAVVKLPVSNL